MRTSIALFLATAAAACTGNRATSSIDIPLTQTGGDGNVYHLTATFTIAEATGAIVTVDGSTTDPTVTVNDLPPGTTSLSLAAGWTLARSTDAGATFQPVDAILASPNPSTVRVLANQPSSVELDFIVRDPNGSLTVQLGVASKPRELAGGMIVQSGTLDYAPYLGAKLDFAIYHEAAPVKQTLADGTKQLQFTSLQFNAMEAFNDPVGLIANTVAPLMADGNLIYTIAAKPDGTTVVGGTYQSGVCPCTTITFGPDTLAQALALDADGFPVDAFLFDSTMPFTADTSFADGDATFAGQLRLRIVPPAP
jgi:hypothetical protein